MTRPTLAPGPFVGHYAGAWTELERALIEHAVQDCGHSADGAKSRGREAGAAPAERTPPLRVCLKLDTSTGPHFAAYEYPDGRLLNAQTAGVLAREICRAHDEPSEPPQGGILPFRLRRVLDFVRDNVGARVTLGGMAERARMSEAHFSREFRRTLGLTPMAYVAQVRAEESADLLARTDLAMAEIAVLAGYATASHFAARFRDWAGTTPSGYRTRHAE